ncbi:alpha/beta fold hydrolase [Flaviflexus huanghaiensis]|uniref:alpha/beta fold hydrolase n=1 Tax=Flaviflexus huanghaiensis TaxID=1111473 RepID=UPI0015FB92A6|nr:alpha/beta fold hydrolase [Flaviflexus huanghaiensis]
METDTYRIAADTYLDHRMSVPLDRSGALPGTITLFSREIVRHGKENAPRLVFFQGGPGSPAPRPEPVSGWIDWALDHYRVVLIDQRGTGASDPLDAAVIGDERDPQAQADFLSCFRADSIIDDAEDLRRTLQEDEPWHVLGQSYGGFINTAYLSRAPHGLASVMITAGLPSVTRHAIDTYRATWQLTEKRNAAMYRTFPGLAQRVWDVAVHLDEHDERLATGERLTAARLRMLGLVLGYSYGPQSLHFLFENPFVTINGQKRLSSRFLLQTSDRLTFGPNPLYGVLHETIYAGTAPGPTNWAAHRARAEFPQFALPGTGESPFATEREARGAGADFLFSGEHVFPWQMREDPALAPLAEAADLLATRNFDSLYDSAALAENTVPASGWIYWDDMFVPATLSLETAEQIASFEPIMTNDYHHDGLRADGAKLLERMHALNSRRTGS